MGHRQNVDVALCAAASQNSCTALIRASEMGHLEMVRALQDAGADVEAMDKVCGLIGHWDGGGGREGKWDRGEGVNGVI